MSYGHSVQCTSIGHANIKLQVQVLKLKTVDAKVLSVRIVLDLSPATCFDGVTTC